MALQHREAALSTGLDVLVGHLIPEVPTHAQDDGRFLDRHGFAFSQLRHGFAFSKLRHVGPFLVATHHGTIRIRKGRYGTLRLVGIETKITRDEKLRGRPYVVTLQDSDFPTHTGIFAFWWNEADGPQGAYYAIRVRHPGDLEAAERARGAIPVHKWRTAARAALMRKQTPRFGRDGKPRTPEPDETLSEADRRYFEIAQEYRTNVARGSDKPVTEISVRHGVAPVAARNWVRRARERGFLGPTMRRRHDPASIDLLLGGQPPFGWEE